MHRRVGPGLVRVLVVALAFGLLSAWVKGQDTDARTGLAPLRSVLGNLSATWLVLPFWAGTGRRRAAAAGVGLVATVVALLAFYGFTGWVIDLDGKGFPADVPLWVRANRAYVQAGLLTGPLLGLLGGWWAVRRRPRPIVLLGALLVAEPLVLLGLGLLRPLTQPLVDLGVALPMAFRLLPGWGLSLRDPTQTLAVYATEAGLGVLLLARAHRTRRVRRSGA